MLGTAEVYVPTTKDYLDIVFRRRWPYVLGLLVGCLLVSFMQSRQLASYQSDALVFVQERSKSTTFVQGLSRTSNFAERWLKIQNLIFNQNTIKTHTGHFAGIIPYHPPREDSLERDYLNDQNRYAMVRRVPYDLNHDRYVTLTPYQWWMVRETLDELGWLPPISDGNTERQVKNRVGVAHWFWINIFNPMEQGLGWPREDGRIIKGSVTTGKDGREVDARLGEIVEIDQSAITNIDREYAKKIMVDGRFNEAEISRNFLANTTLTVRDFEIIQSKEFTRSVESTVSRGVIPDGFKVSFTSGNPRVTRFIVAWVVEMVFRFNEYYQYKEIFESQGLLENQLEIAIKKLNEIQGKVSEFLVENVERYETAMSHYIQNARNPDGGAKGQFPTVVQYQPPENAVREAYNRTTRELEESELRIFQAEGELETVKKQLDREDPEVRSKVITTNPDYMKFQTELLELENERQKELFSKTLKHPHVVDLTRKIDAFKATLGKLKKDVLSESSVDTNPRYRDLKEKHDQLEIEIFGRQRSLGELKIRKKLLFGELKKAPAIEQRIQNYKSELGERQSSVSMLQQRINRVKTEEQFTFALAKVEYTIKILPTLPDNPQDNILIHIGMAIVLFIFVSGITIFFCEFLDVTVKEISDVNRYLDVNVIGVIPKIPMDAIVTGQRNARPRADRPKSDGNKKERVSSRSRFMNIFRKKS